MAVLGFQLVTTLIGACILSKIVTYFSFTRFVFDGLSRFLAPSDQLLLDASGNLKTKGKNKKRRPDASSTIGGDPYSQPTFYFPRAMSIQLHTTNITHSEVATLPMFSTFQWLLDFTVCAVVLYLFTEFSRNSPLLWFNWMTSNQSAVPLSTFRPKPSVLGAFSLNTNLNLSIVWLFLVAWFSLRSLISMTAIYFRTYPTESPNTESHATNNNTTSGEWLLVVAAGFFFVLSATVLMALDGRYLEFELQRAYSNLTINTINSPDTPIFSWLVFNAMLAIGCASIGALFVYPGMKFGKIYLDAVSKNPITTCQRLLFHLTFIMPLFSMLLWVKPLTDHLQRSLLALSFNPTVMQRPTLLALVTVAAELVNTEIDALRLLSCALVVLLRLLLTRGVLQVYLNSAQNKLERFSREPGQTSNKEVQRLVASIFYCINLVALQWLAPTILLLSIVCIYKSTAGLSWIPFSSLPVTPSPNPTFRQSSEFGESTAAYSWMNNLYEARFVFTRFTQYLSIRGMAVSQGVLGFLVWWCLFALQSVSLLGLAYHRFTLDY